MKHLAVISLIANCIFTALIYRYHRALLKQTWKRCLNKAKLYRILSYKFDANSVEGIQTEARVQKWCDLAERFKHPLFPDRDRSEL